MSQLEIFGVISSALSITLSVIAIWLSLHFYERSKESEKQLSNSLAKIDAQTEALQKVNAKWMDRLTKYVTTDTPAQPDPYFAQVVAVLTELPNAITTRMAKPDVNDAQSQLVDELLSSYIAIYHYAALTNFWAQFYLPSAAEYDAENSFHGLTKRVVDSSFQDFNHIAKLLQQADQKRLNRNPLVHLLDDTLTEWRDSVRSSSDVYIHRASASHT
ncbi:MAG: hypothetical protein K2Q28_07470 [Hyphomicrobium sp.]|nr:hypothetical protein [Hyphomicrobium sp.]